MDPTVAAFLEKINAAHGPPLYEMSVDEARNVLTKVQDIGIPKMPADVREINIPGGPKGNIPAHIVRPKGSTEALPAIMYFHGGGWVLGDFNIFERLIRELANQVNAAVIFVDYTRSPEARYPVAIEQDYRATEYVAENGDKLNVDSSKLAIAGDSVGGNMTAVISMLAKQRKGPKIKYQVLFYPVTDASFDTQSYGQFASGYWLAREGMKWFWDNYLQDKEARKQPTASPLRASVDQLRGLPPALVVTNEYDVLRDEGEAYAHKLMEAGVPTTGVRFLGTVHDMLMINALEGTPAARGAIGLAGDLLTKAFLK
jgi:acetyl esterase/lipase